MTDEELLASIARKIITGADYFDIVHPAQRSKALGPESYIVIDSSIAGFTTDELDLMSRLQSTAD